MRKRSIAWLIVAMLATTLAGIGGGAAWLLYTESGLNWLATRVTGFAGEGLTLDGVAGTLAGGASIAHIRYAGEDIEIHVENARLAVSAYSLLVLRPRIAGLRAAQIAVVTKPSEPRGRPPDTLELPVSFELANARVERLVIDLGKGPLELTNIHLDYSGGRSDHSVHDLSLYAFGHAVAVRGSIGATAPFPLKATLAAVRPDTPQTVVYAAAKGDLTEIALQGGATSGVARIGFTAAARPYDALPLSALTAHSAALDLNALAPELPRTSLNIDIDLKRSGELYGGGVRVTNALTGTYDKGRLPISALRADVRTDGETMRLSGVVADLGGAGTITGSGDIDRKTAQLALTTRRLNLAGLHAQLRETRLAGRADFVITQARQSVTAELSEADITLQLSAQRAGNTVDIPQFRARARGGEARGKARVELTARRPFSLDATLSRFDPAAWGTFPSGSINATVSAEGAIAGPELDASFVIRDSRWLSAALAARGKIAVYGERLRNADVEATLGGNSIVAKGALGNPQDTLAIRFDAPRLAIVDRRLQGTTRGTIQLTGSWRAPAVRFDIAGADLAHETYGRIKTIAARGSLNTDPAGPFEVDATLRGYSAPQWQLSSAALSVKGTRSAHTAIVRAQGDRIDFDARASGGWRTGTGWTGSVLQLTNRGDAQVELAAPVPITVGPQRALAQAFELRVIGGTLAVKQLSYEHGRLSTAGRFADVPVRPIVALAGGPADMAGTLRLTGDWSVTNVPQLTGSISIRRESGDVSFGAGKPMRIGLEALTVDARFSGGELRVQGRLRSVLASAAIDGRVAAVGGRYVKASPVAFTAQVDVARLGVLASLIDTTVLLDGALMARLEGTGTVGDPHVTGPLTAERLAVALPAEGIDLKGGTLKARLTEREVRVDSFSIRGGEGVLSAQGTLARAGFDEASLDWRAERFTVLTRPDRRLVVTGKGNAGLRAGKLALTGALRANEGVFELGTAALPTLGDDVVIAGRGIPRAADPKPEPRALPRATIDVAIDLGNNVHVLGYGLDVWLSGEVRVQTNARGEIRANGTVDARRGTFVAYGQRLEIEHGRLYFNGPPANPALDILAMRKRQAVQAGVAVTGTLTRPLVRVVSNPSLPEGEALSWLVLGRAPGTAGAGQLSALPLATGAIAGKVGAPLARALRLDEISMGGSGSASQQFLTVGKRITDRIYVVFEQSLGGAENLLRLEMSLTERIALRAQAGQTSSFGVFYRYGWD